MEENPLQTELEAILARLAAAKSDAEKAMLAAQYGERIAHLKARGAKAPEPKAPASDPPPLPAKAAS